MNEADFLVFKISIGFVIMTLVIFQVEAYRHVAVCSYRGSIKCLIPCQISLQTN